jgi:hypothetical protein
MKLEELRGGEAGCGPHKCRETRDQPQDSIFLLPHLSALHLKLTSQMFTSREMTYTCSSLVVDASNV